MYGTTIGDIKGDTRSLDYGSYRVAQDLKMILVSIWPPTTGPKKEHCS